MPKSKPKSSAKPKLNQPKTPELNRNLLKMVSVASMSAFVFFSYLGFTSAEGIYSYYSSPTPTTVVVAGNQQAVLGVTSDEATPVEILPEADIKLNNSNIGEALLELHLTDSLNVAGVELYIDVEDSLDVTGVTCADTMRCITSTYEDGVIHLLLLAEADAVELSEGRVVIANISYDPETSGELMIDNREGSRLSKVLEKGKTRNLITKTVQYLAVGRQIN